MIVEYVCPKCGFFNASLQALKEQSQQQSSSQQHATSSQLHPSDNAQVPTPLSPTSPSPRPFTLPAAQQPTPSSVATVAGTNQIRRRVINNNNNSGAKTERRKSGLSKSVLISEDEEDQSQHQDTKVDGEQEEDLDEDVSEVGETTVLMEVDG